MGLRHIPLAALVATAALAGCGGDDEPSLDGTYGITVAEEDITDSGGAEPGQWTISINAGDASLDGPGGRHIPLMPTEMSETRMTLPADPSCPNNRPAPGEGEYEVALNGDSLTFTKVRDPCGDRAFTLTAHTWQRTSS